ncbi:HpcH/HpaI aldolase/citrate lyase family protein [Sporosarcina sp. 6E9]|uniref:HpcH/HpaI aldolase family protein n=1 Tax=Sporosarcina sp. 6E9 TaxID=2819235 RepID=UPI001B3148AD|nr:aldolase/citrate lyase family protein [Sporosarcina sp. 6E9]
MCNTIKEKIQNGQKVTGIFIGIYSPAIVEMCGYAGFDFIVIDDEHGAFSYSELENMIRTAELVNLAPVVRVSYDDASIQKALDRGAVGIQVPMVSTKEEAIQVVNKAKFPPLGNRGVAYSHRAARYGKDTGQKFIEQSNDEVLVAVHVETREAVENFEEIMNVEGIDIAFLGTTDLSVNMGYPDGPQHQDVQEAIALVYEKARELEVPIGTVAGNESMARQAFESGSVYVVAVGTTMIANTFSTFIKSVDASKE